MAYLLQDDDNPMEDRPYNDGLEMEIEPMARSQKGKGRQRDLEPTSSRDERARRQRSPSPGEVETRSRVNRQAARMNRQRSDSVGTSASTEGLWKNDATLGIVSHVAPCSTCKSYAMHLFQYKFERDPLYLNAVDCRDREISAKERALANQRYDDYEDELNELKATIASLEDELDRLRHGGHQNKRARTRSEERRVGKECQ